MMAENPDEFRKHVQGFVAPSVAAINRLSANGMYFFDYGNAFLLQSKRAGADICRENGKFQLSVVCAGHYGTDVLRLRFRTVPLGLHTSGDPADLSKTDEIAARA